MRIAFFRSLGSIMRRMTTWKTYSKKVSKRSNYKSKEAFRSIHMGVYNSIHLNSFVKNKSVFFSLIILVENFGYIFWRKNLNLKYLVLLINLKYLLKKSGQNIKVMRFNKEDKFTSKKFEEHYENHEIRWPLTISYFP